MTDQKLPEGGSANTDLDSEDQRHLRYVVLEEIEQVLRKHNCGGAIFVNSIDSAAWRYVHPEWGGIKTEVNEEGQIAHRIRINSKTLEARKRGDATLGYIGTMRDMAGQAFLMYEHFWKQAVEALGGEENIIHEFHDMSTIVGKPISKPEDAP